MRGGRRRRLPRAGGCASRRHDADGAGRGRGRRVDRTPHAATIPVALGRELLRRVAERVRVVVTRPRRRRPSRSPRALEALGHEVVRCPLIAIEPLGDEPSTVAGYDWVVVTSPNGADELARRGCAAAPTRRGDRAGHRRRARRATGSSRPRPERLTQEGLLAELPRPAGRVLFAAAEGARRLLVDELDARLPAALPHGRAARRRHPEGDVVAARVARRRARAFAATGARIPVVSIGPQTTADGARRRARGRGRGRRRTTSTGWSRRSSRAARVSVDARSSRSSPTSACRTTSSAPATA